MSVQPLPAGKLPESLLAELLESGRPLPAEVLVGPRIGEDACAISIPSGELVVATDPITLTGSAVGAHAVTINANDVAVMGTAPRWFLAVVLLPLGTTEDDVRALFTGMRESLDAAGIALVGGHTEITPAVTQNVVIGQMLGLAPPGGVVRTGGLSPGDVVVQVGAAPVEGAAVMAELFASRLSGVNEKTLAAALAAATDPGISVVEPALLAARLGATALHDPTEGGLAAGLYELAGASGLDLCIDLAEVSWFDPGVVLCEALGANPLGMLASGALLAGFEPSRAGAAVRELEELGLRVTTLGTAQPAREAGQSGRVWNGGEALPRFARDELARLIDENAD